MNGTRDAEELVGARLVPRQLVLGLLFLCLAAGLGGCAAVLAEKPIGATPVALAPEQWNGSWFNGEDALVVEVTEPDAGVMQVALVEYKEGGFALQQMTAVVRQGDQWQFINVKAEDSGGRYQWARMSREGELLLIWPPEPAPLRELVENGSLAGKVEDDDVILPGSSPELIQLLEGDGGGRFFKWDGPLVLYRLGH